MSGYVLAGYGLTVGVLGLYAARVLQRGRSLSRSVPAEVPPPGPGRGVEDGRGLEGGP